MKQKLLVLGEKGASALLAPDKLSLAPVRPRPTIVYAQLMTEAFALVSEDDFSTGEAGDYLIRCGTDDRFYVCPREAFLQQYEIGVPLPVDEEPAIVPEGVKAHG